MSDYEISPIDRILDENDVEPIVLYDDEENRTEFDQVAVIPMDDKIYVILCPITPIEGVGEDEGIVFVIDEQDGEECLSVVTDDETVDKVFCEYEALVAAEDGE